LDLRLKSAIWVSAFLRRSMVAGLYGAVIHKGAEEAGSVYVIINHLDQTCHFFGPAPGPAYDENGERRWVEELKYPASMPDILAVIDKKRRFDPDFWVVEVEDRKGTAGLAATA
jgi:hypothetical protein